MRTWVGAITAAAMALSLPTAAWSAEDTAASAWIEQSRALSRRLGEELKVALTSAMEEGGPISAITVCRDRAPAIAARLSAESGARVGRTALAVRNPANAADELDHAVLESFARSLADGGAEGPLEAAFWMSRGGATERRYLRAIVTEAVCVTCHGAEIAPDLASAIAREYPQDAARGFVPGQLRGAFRVVWPAAKESR